LASTRRSRLASFSACFIMSMSHTASTLVKTGHRNRERGARVGYLGERVPGPWPVPSRSRRGRHLLLLLMVRRLLVVRVLPAAAGAGAAGARGRLDAHLP
jgi:hypothetical protein